MPPRTHTPRTEDSFPTVDVDRRSQVIVLRGPIHGAAVDELRETLVAAIEGGVRDVVLDVTDVESIGVAAHDLVSAASITLADRGGALLVWSRKKAVGEPIYVITDVRDRTLAEVMPAPGKAGRQGRGRA
jgi:anti-anti-sigma factor